MSSDWLWNILDENIQNMTEKQCEEKIFLDELSRDNLCDSTIGLISIHVVLSSIGKEVEEKASMLQHFYEKIHIS